MGTTFEQLKALLTLSARPVKTGTAEEWAEARRRLGRRFPVDYCQFVSTYGSCAIDNFYLTILNPFVEDGSFWRDLERERAIDAEDVEVCDPHDTGMWFPRPRGMIPWGSTDDGRNMLWLANDSDPDGWAVFEEWDTSGMTFDGGMEDFLLASLRQERVGLSLGAGSVPTYVDPLVPMTHGGATFSPELLWDDAAVATMCRVFAVASRRGDNSLVMRPGGWIVSWWANSFSLSVPPEDLPKARELVLELVSALHVSIVSIHPESWSDMVNTP